MDYLTFLGYVAATGLVVGLLALVILGCYFAYCIIKAN